MIPSNILKPIESELKRAVNSFEPYNSYHEGYAVIKEELDELWTEIKKRGSSRKDKKVRNEALQVAVTSIRFLMDLC